MRLVRSEMLEVLRTDYIKFARARGLTDRAIHFGHALKNTLVPVITIVGLQLGSIIAFAIVTETVFQWPGMGLLFIQAVYFADIPGDGRLPVLHRAGVRGHQPRGRPPLLRGRPAPAHRSASTCRPRTECRHEAQPLHRPLAGRVHRHPPRPARASRARVRGGAHGARRARGPGRARHRAPHRHRQDRHRGRDPGARATPAGAAWACAPTWTRCRCRRRTTSRTSRATRDACTAAATTATRPCCWRRRATCTRRATSTARRSSSSSRARKATRAPRR